MTMVAWIVAFFPMSALVLAMMEVMSAALFSSSGVHAKRGLFGSLQVLGAWVT